MAFWDWITARVSELLEAKRGGQRRRARPRVEVLEDRSVPATFTVTKDADDGTAGTFRWAIEQANGNANPNVLDVIDFNIGVQGTAKTITLDAVRGELPTITEQVLIDGFTQGGALADPKPWIELAGQNLVNGANGLTVGAGNVTICGLAINRFQRTAGGLKGSGIEINNPAGSPGGWVYGCYIGTNVTGTAAGLGNAQGIVITGSGNTVGDYLTGQVPTVISGNTSSGVEIAAAIQMPGQPPPPAAILNQVVACYIGLDWTGMAALANAGAGVYLGAGAVNNTIGGFDTQTAELGNVISANGTSGVHISSTHQNKIINNVIGLAVDGSTVRGNVTHGVRIIGGTNNELLGRNIIAGNLQNGVLISGTSATGNKVYGAYIGTNRDGTAARANGMRGVLVQNAQNNYIGGVLVGQGNVISGNGTDGVGLIGADAKFNKVYSNTIGLNAAGDTALPNGANGVEITGSSNEIGAAGINVSNVISGNTNNGILIDAGYATSNVIVNNYIGTNKAGNVARGNGDSGIKIEGAQSNIIGGQNAQSRNVISGNGGDGIWIALANAQLNLVQGNYIGLAKNGINTLGNAMSGVRMDQGATNNTVGGVAEGARNFIAGNTGFGVQFVGGATSGNTVQGNTIGKDTAGDDKPNGAGWQSDPLGLNNWLNNDHD